MENEKRVFGSIDSKYDVRDYTISTATATPIPPAFKLKLPKIIKNQGCVGSCVAHSCSYAVEYFNNLQEKNDDQFSVGFIYGTRLDGQYKGTGMMLREALSNLRKFGDVKMRDYNKNEEYPEIVNDLNKVRKTLEPLAYPNRISTYFRLFTKAQIQRALMSYGYVLVSIDWFSDAKVENGILKSKRLSNDCVGGHAVTIYGWNEKGWLMLNSWGNTWGTNGTVIIPFDYPFNEAWGITDTITSETKGETIKVNNTGIRKSCYKAINFVVNRYKKYKKYFNN